jgi:hypothetical protein
MVLLLFYIRKKKAQYHIKQWVKSLNLTQHALIYEKLYEDANGFKLSNQARQTHNAIEYTYGEIEFLPFIALLSLVKPDKDTVFYDLGSGIGKAVLAYAMVYPAHKYVGIELFSELHQSACQHAQLLQAIPEYEERSQKIVFILGDYFKEDLSEATLIFINSTALFGETWSKLCLRLSHLPKIQTVITTSKALASHEFALIKKTKIQMSWGVVFAYIHKRKTNFH